MLQFYVTITTALIAATYHYGLIVNAEVIDSIEHGYRPGRIKPNCTCGTVNRDIERIIGGDKSGRHEWPMMAAIIARKWHLTKNILVCSGTVITERHILTAAQCVYNEKYKYQDESNIGIIVGIQDLSKVNLDDPNSMITPEFFRIHPNYDEIGHSFDIGIFMIPPLTLSKFIVPVCLPTKRFSIKDRKLKVLGWGFKTVEGPKAHHLRKGNVFGVGITDCKAIYKMHKGWTPFDEHERHRMCTYSKNVSVCTADTGGPLLWVDAKSNRYVQVGIASFGPDNCKGYASVSTDVSYFVPWIQQVISDSHPELKTCARVDE